MRRASYDADAKLFFDAIEEAGGTLTEVHKGAINNIVKGFKVNGTWPKKRAVFPMVGGTSLTHSFNLISPHLYRLAYSGSITHNASGMKFAGATNSFATITGFTDTVLGLSDVHISFWDSGPDTDANSAELGLWLSSGRIFIQSKSANQMVAAYRDYLVTPSIGTGVGLSTLDYGGGTQVNYKNGVNVGSVTRAVIGSTIGREFMLGGLSDGSTVSQAPSAKRCAYAEFGRTQTATETLNDYNLLASYQAALGR